MHKMLTIIVGLIALSIAQEIPVPLDNGEGTKSSGVSISGTPPAQFRVYAGMRTLAGDERPYKFTFVSNNYEYWGAFNDTTVFSDTILAKKKGSWGFGAALESDIQRRLHLAIGFDGQFGTFSLVNFGLGVGYNHPLVKNKVYLQLKADFLFGRSMVDIGNIPIKHYLGHDSGYIKINSTWFFDKTVSVSMSSSSMLCRPELNLYFRVKPKRFLMIGGGYQVSLASPETKFEFTANNDNTDEIGTETIEQDSPNIDFILGGEKSGKIKLEPKGLTISASYVFEL